MNNKTNSNNSVQQEEETLTNTNKDQQEEHGGGKDYIVKVDDADDDDDDEGQTSPSRSVASVEQTSADAPKKRTSQRTKQLTCETAATCEEDDFFFVPSSYLGHTIEQDPNKEQSSQGNSHSRDEHEDARSTLSELTVAESGDKVERGGKNDRNRQWTALGCLSSTLVLTVRLLLDREPTAYFIHSWIVFVDMVLIHCFTKSVWLSVTGELMTIIFFLSFHFTKETVFELAETTFIAVLCSLHMIRSRSKALVKMEVLEEIVEEMSIRSADQHLQQLKEMEEGYSTKKQQAMVSSSGLLVVPDWLSAPSRLELRKQSKKWGRHFFEHFLDGSAGVMYTSFVGLIISEIINYGGSKSYKCE